MELKLDAYKNQLRLLLLFSHTAGDGFYRQQKALLQQDEPGMADRDLLLIEIIRNDCVLINGEKQQDMTVYDLREELNADENMFLLVLWGKDGTEKARFERPVELPVIFGKVDGLPCSGKS